MKLDFDEILKSDELWAEVQQATGKGVRVALLDTGVDFTHPAFADAVISSVEVVPGGPQGLICREVPKEGVPPAELDPVGHGTACAGILHELAPEAELVSVRVLGAGAVGRGEQFVRGLQWVLEQQERPIHVANLSLGSTVPKFAEPLRHLAERAFYQGPILVAAANNMGLPSYPAQFASLISVDNASLDQPLKFQFHNGRNPELVARGIYVRAPQSGGGYQLWTGTSFACPHMSALVARLLSINPRLQAYQVRTLLRALRTNRET